MFEVIATLMMPDGMEMIKTEKVEWNSDEKWVALVFKGLIW